ncbi:Predicted PurR-regulated permease PerM [Catalinimonas alkaloidigena]|uniref:Predicted PurR-regulated permease PerM n=1 Tax=Catalinimonas alkaloidigena TaxID=1075417 RepID=A0A1G9MNX2_9BACT|nr:AI-2E family transporter [Catalinimonas alkaloidigena]SDL75919.1 Predicted PurR-regulated permease PerM [Catalinimonas alkaloidigena]
MMKIKLPLYAQVVLILIGITILVSFLDVAKSLLAPLAFSLLFALLLLPVCSRLERWRFPRSLAIVISLLLVIAVVGGIIFVFSNQILHFRSEIPELTEKFNEYVDSIQSYIETRFGIESEAQSQYLKDSAMEVASSSGRILSSTAGATTNTLAAAALVPIFFFFLLYYRDFFKEFLYRLFRPEHHSTLGEVLNHIKELIQSYITGLLTVIFIISMLNSVGLLVLGVRHAFFFGFLAGVLNIIPYVGVFIGSLLPIAYALVTMESPWYAVGVAAIFWFVQFAEGNFITPNIVGSKVSLNPLTSIVALLIGAMIWGPTGMILSIPFTAMLKVILDYIPGYRPLGFVMGEPEVERKRAPKDQAPDHTPPPPDATEVVVYEKKQSTT